MEETRIIEKERWLRQEYPAMFSHQDLRPGEVYISKQVIDVVAMNVFFYQDGGLRSARVGDRPETGRLEGIDADLEFRSIFADLREYIILMLQNEDRQVKPNL